jgi:hypothetical protein
MLRLLFSDPLFQNLLLGFVFWTFIFVHFSKKFDNLEPTKAEKQNLEIIYIIFNLKRKILLGR